MHDVTGLALDALQLGISHLQGTAAPAEDRVRRLGGGRKPIMEMYPEIEDALLKLIAESTQVDPESPLLWTTTSLCHLHPVTSWWNRIEHHMFSFISLNWRGRPLTSYEVVVELIGHTTTESGLGITANLDRGTYEIGKKVDAEALDNLLIERPENQNQQWNYTIRPHAKTVTTNS